MTTRHVAAPKRQKFNGSAQPKHNETRKPHVTQPPPKHHEKPRQRETRLPPREQPKMPNALLMLRKRQQKPLQRTNALATP
jgi:hypothetical protein